MRSRRHNRLAALGVVGLAAFAQPEPAAAQVFTFTNLTEAAGGPGTGSFPSINDEGDVAFMSGDAVYCFDRQAGAFSNINALPGAPARGWYPKLNGRGDIAFVDPGTRDLWLYEAATRALTDVSRLPGYPGNSGAHSLNSVFDLNDAGQISFHSGDLNYRRVWVYTHATRVFLEVTGHPGAPFRGRDNAINDAGRVAYSGFPDIYVFDIASRTARR